MALELERQTTVLFAKVLGDADASACRDHLRQAAQACGARVVNRAADKLMALLPAPDAAAEAAAAMHTAMDSFAQTTRTKLALGIGFHHGPVIQKESEVFGDTVNLAARLVDQAASGQIITTRETAAQLSALYRAWMRKLYSIDIKGRSEPVALCELVWRVDENTTLYSKKRNATRAATTATLTLSYRDRKIVRRRDRDSVTLGRDENCAIPIADDQASRMHCTIERRQDKFILTDHSTNGTYVAVNGGDEVLVQREEFTLSGQGSIACGQPAAATREIVRFNVD